LLGMHLVLTPPKANERSPYLLSNEGDSSDTLYPQNDKESKSLRVQ
jgi:hypothetical protein